MPKRLSVEGVKPLHIKAGDGLGCALVWISAGYVRPESPIRYAVEYCPHTFNVVQAEHMTKTGWRRCPHNSLPRLRDIINPALEAAVTRGAFNTLRSGERVA